jgi:hypothetical protein
MEHHPKSLALFKAIAALDFEMGGDYFHFKHGGDGDNGEHLMYLMDELFEAEEGRADIAWKCDKCGKAYSAQTIREVRGDGCVQCQSWAISPVIPAPAPLPESEFVSRKGLRTRPHTVDTVLGPVQVHLATRAGQLGWEAIFEKEGLRLYFANKDGSPLGRKEADAMIQSGAQAIKEEWGHGDG